MNKKLVLREETVNALRWIIEILDRQKIDYQITGGFAGKLYGSPRDLNDIDIDIPEKEFSTILPEVSGHISDGPNRYNDGKWDGEFITLNYHGQQIDIGGIDTLRISNKERTTWIPYQTNWFKTLPLTVEGMKVNVLHPRELATYKKELDGDHQLVDIEAAENYASEHGL